MIEFKPIYKENNTEIPNRCSYCRNHIFLRPIDRHSYKLNGKYICWSCLSDYAYKLGVSTKDLIKGGD